MLRSQMSLQRGINLRALAEKMGNCSGAEVRGICTEAGEGQWEEGLVRPVLIVLFPSRLLPASNRHVRSARTPSARDARRFRDGRRKVSVAAFTGRAMPCLFGRH